MLRRRFSVRPKKSKPATLWSILDILTYGSWVLDPKDFHTWINSSRQTSVTLLPRQRHRWRFWAGNLWMSGHAARFLLYFILYNHFEEIVIDSQLVSPRFPVYLSPMFLLLMSSFAFYMIVSLFCTTASAAVISPIFYLFKKNRTNKYLHWYQIYVYLEAMVTGRGREWVNLPLLRSVPGFLYRKYQQHFQKLVRVLRTNSINNTMASVMLYAFMLYLVSQHPEWRYPLWATAIAAAFCQFWYVSILKVRLYRDFKSLLKNKLSNFQTNFQKQIF